MLLKEGNDLIAQVFQTSHAISHSLSMIPSNHTAPKETLESEEQLDIALVLHYCEFGEDLKSRGHFWVRIDADEETAFSINKSHNPLCLQPCRR